MDLPAGPVQEYIRIAGIAAVYVASSPSSTCRIDTSRDLKRTQTFLHKQGHDLTIASAFWVNNPKTATKIASKVNRTIQRRVDGVLAVTAATALIETTATEMKTHLTEHAAVMQRAESAMAHVRTTLERARKNGGLNGSTGPMSTSGRERRYAGGQP